MNILIASTGGHIGGEETFTKNLAIALIMRDYNVWVAPGGQAQMDDLIKSNIPISDIDIKGRSLIGVCKGAKAIRTFVRKNKIDIVHCQAAGPALMGGIIKKMHWTHGEKWIYHDHGINKSTYKWLPLFLNLLDLIIANSDYQLIKLKSDGVRDSKICRIHNGIDLKEFDFEEAEKYKNRNEIRKELGLSENEFVVGFIGRLSPEKGCDLILPAFKKVIEKKNNTRLLIIGDGFLRTTLEKEMRSDKLYDKVIFTGFCSDIPRILCCINTLILPSYTETFSLTTLQAMGAGIPVISSDAGGNPEQIIPNFNGYLFESGNYIDLSIKIIDMINNENPIKMGNNGKELIKNYLNTKRMIDEIEFYYKRNVS